MSTPNKKDDVAGALINMINMDPSTLVCSFCRLPETPTRNFDKFKCLRANQHDIATQHVKRNTGKNTGMSGNVSLQRSK